MNQDQANAIAESQPHAYDDALGDQTPVKGDMEGAALILNRAFSRGYAKCLMDMNPLIEAGEHLSEAVKWSHDDADYKAPEQFTKTYVYGRYLNPLTKKAVEFDTALSNLTKNIEP